MLRIFDTYQNRLVQFVPIKDKSVSMYVCGPTVYDLAHLGHARCYITWDVVFRYLKFLGYDVKYCRNVTDVDDKILEKADKLGSTQQEVSKKYYQLFKRSMEALNVSEPTYEPFATNCIGDMIKMIKCLIDLGFAYKVEREGGCDVYFKVAKFDRYGELSKQPLDDLKSGIRVDIDKSKLSPLDFALWKVDLKHGYNSPFGKGRPGWHIECSAMAKKYLSDTIDIHAGGADLIFPHHENEIAQSECANSTRFAKYWLHNGFVTINKEKMSKSLSNFVTIDALLEKYDANTIRLFILTNNYRMPIEFSDESLISAQNGFKRLENAYKNAFNFVGEPKSHLDEKDYESIELFKQAMDDDFNTSKALAVLFDLASNINKNIEENNPEITLINFSMLSLLSDVLGFTFSQNKVSPQFLEKFLRPLLDEVDFIDVDLKSMEIESACQVLLEKRNQARLSKNWELSDKIRDIFDLAGITIKDLKDDSKLELK